MEQLDGMVKSYGRETFWALIALLVILAGFTIYLDSEPGLQIFKASITPVIVLGLGALGYHKASGIMAAKR